MHLLLYSYTDALHAFNTASSEGQSPSRQAWRRVHSVTRRDLCLGSFPEGKRVQQATLRLNVKSIDLSKTKTLLSAKMPILQPLIRDLK